MGTVVFAGISTEKCHFTFVCMSIMSSMQLYFNKAVLYGLTGKKSCQLFPTMQLVEMQHVSVSFHFEFHFLSITTVVFFF